MESETPEIFYYIILLPNVLFSKTYTPSVKKLDLFGLICCPFIGMDQFDRDSTIADFKNGVTKLMVSKVASVPVTGSY